MASTTTPRPGQRPSGSGFGESETGLAELTAEELPPPPPPVEIPDHARRDAWVVGGLDPVRLGLGPDPWRAASGAFLSGLMRRTEPPLASRWAHIALRNGLIAKARAAAQRQSGGLDRRAGWLLLRMGEADAARML